jgi:nicotinate-nucleotide pyrophosphorylase (carboxylating)
MMRVTPYLASVIDHALSEDAAFNDVSTAALIAPDVEAEAYLRPKASGTLAGVDVAMAVFLRIDPGLVATPLLRDGAGLSPGSEIGHIRGSAASILSGERTTLNFLQRMSGIATETARYVEAVEGLKARIVDTRKTAPGMRELDKYAVRIGGGHNHRLNLSDGILIKDNHIALLRAQGLDLRAAVERAIQGSPHTLRVEVEVASLEEVRQTLEAGAHVIMLDNMSIDAIRQAVEIVGGRALLEASGRITLENVRAVAETGVDLISVGALTHSAKALDISLDVVV